jgi:hypothetical protein
MRFSHVLDARLKSIKAATPLTLDAAFVLTDQLRVSLQAIHRFDNEIAELAPKHPDYSLFSALSVYLNALKRRGSPLLNPSTTVKMA